MGQWVWESAKLTNGMQSTQSFVPELGKSAGATAIHQWVNPIHSTLDLRSFAWNNGRVLAISCQTS